MLLLEGRGFGHADFWLLPGGGAEPGESLEDCARREVYEETSHRVGGPLWGPVWRRAHTWEAPRGLWYRSEEHFFVEEVDARFEAAFAQRDDPERAVITAHRWWSVGEIARSDATFAPRRLAVLLGMLQAPYGPEIEVGL